MQPLTNSFVMKRVLQYLIAIIPIIPACSTINETSKKQMETGIYNVRNYKNNPFYVNVSEDSIMLHPFRKTKAGWITDTSRNSSIALHSSNPRNRQRTKFINRSFDLDVISILFKYRPYTSGFPNQLNTNFNAAEFIGHRTDLYILSYDKDPLNTYRRRINHFAFSIGGFIGLGATQMNPFVTNNNITSEYDGLVITKGIAGLVGVGDFTVGAALGFDNLLDKNRKVWIYENKPWFGFNVGFNIN